MPKKAKTVKKSAVNVPVDGLTQAPDEPCLSSETPQEALKRLITAPRWYTKDIRVIAWSEGAWHMWHQE
jgi:hypothetical protein